MQSMLVNLPLVLAKVASLPWKVFITAISSSCKMSLNKETASPSLSGKRSPVTAWSSLSCVGTPIRSLRSVTMHVLPLGVSNSLLLSHVERRSMACSTAHILRLPWPVHHHCGEIILPVSKPDSSCSSLQSRRSVEHPHHVLWLPKFLVHENRQPLQPCSRISSARTPMLSRNVAHGGWRQICAQSHPTGGKKGSRVPVRPTMCASIS